MQQCDGETIHSGTSWHDRVAVQWAAATVTTQHVAAPRGATGSSVMAAAQLQWQDTQRRNDRGMTAAAQHPAVGWRHKCGGGMTVGSVAAVAQSAAVQSRHDVWWRSRGMTGGGGTMCGGAVKAQCAVVQQKHDRRQQYTSS